LAPSVKPSSVGDPTAAPTTVAVLRVSQTLTLASFPDENDLVAIDSFKRGFEMGIASTLGLPKDYVRITSLVKTATFRRRFMLAVTVDCQYTIKVPQSVGADASATVTQLSSMIAKATADGSLQTALANNGVSADSISPAIMVDESPSMR
jgi:hypothetical protein